MNTDQDVQVAAACGCSPEETQFCLRWMQDHGAPCEWDKAAEAEYMRALDAWRLAVAA